MVSTALVNKAVYMAVLVGDGWAEAENLKKVVSNRQTDRQTNRRRKKWLKESRVCNLKGM